MRHFYKATMTFSLFVILWGLSSCIAENLSGDPAEKLGVKVGYMKIELNLPEFYAPATKGAETKSMDDRAESAITKESLSVLVFKHDGDKQEFYYLAPISALEPIEGEPHKAMATIKLVKSTNETELFDLVIIANHIIDESILIEGAGLETILKELEYSMPTDGKWNASSDHSTPFPMYGRKNNVEVVENMEAPKISLYRALARIDVGLNFNTEPHPTDSKEEDTYFEEATGLNNFKLKEVLVYRTNNKGYVQVLDNVLEGEELITNVPDDAERNKTPLYYTLNADQMATNAFIREIYVPETDASEEADNAHCVVIGGLFTDASGNTTESYYRLDFAERDSQSVIESLAVFRNHRYVFNIRSIKNAGSPTSTDALNNGFNPSTNDFMYDVIVWDESIHEMQVHGKYFFGLDNREVTFEAKSSEIDPDNMFVLSYQTNYPVTEKDGISFEWESVKSGEEQKFEAFWDNATNSISLKALETNETNEILTDILYVTLDNFIVPVEINQKFINFCYTIDCSTVRVYGTYRPGHLLKEDEHYIKLSITAEDISINGSQYIIETEPSNGIVFKTSGIFDFEGDNLTKEITLVGSGLLDTPIEERNEAFSAIIRSNSSSGSYCEVTIHPVVAKINVLSIGSNSSYGYNIANEFSNSGKVLNEKKNFGPYDYSIVKVEGFNFIHGGTTASPTFTTEAEMWLTGEGNEGVIADIFFIAYSSSYGPKTYQIISDYLKNGGVVIVFSENNSLEPLMQMLFNSPDLQMHKPICTVLPFIGHDVYKELYINPDPDGPNSQTWDEFYASLEDDPILNGPFGDIRNKSWGEDASVPCTVGPLPNIGSELTIYSYGHSLKSSGRLDVINDHASFFRYESDTYNLIFIGDGGFASQSGSSGSITSTSICPFLYDADFFPIPKVYSGGHEVYNSQAFCNIFSWAITRSSSEELQIKKNALKHKITYK